MRDGWSRRTFLRGTLLTGGAVTAPGLLSGCDALGFGDTLDKIRDAGVVKVGHAGERPFAYQESGRLAGAMPAIHGAIFQRLGDIEVEGVQVAFKDLIDGLNAGTFDVVAAGMFIRSERCARAAYSEPVYCATTGLLVANGNPESLSDFASVASAGASLAVLGGAVEADYATDAGVAEDRLRMVSDAEEGLRLVAEGEVDAFSLTSISLRALLEQIRQQEPAPPGAEPAGTDLVAEVELLPAFVPVVEGREQLGCGGAAFRKTDESLRDAFNAELAKLHQEGRVLELTEPYGFTEAEMPRPNVTTEQLCREGGVTGGDLDPLPR